MLRFDSAEVELRALFQLQIMMFETGKFCGQVPVQNLRVRVVVQISQCIRHIQGHLEKLYGTTQQLRVTVRTAGMAAADCMVLTC